MLWSEARAGSSGRRGPWWYLSDGGHFDNTGVYALIEAKVRLHHPVGRQRRPRKYRFADIARTQGAQGAHRPDAEIEFYSRQEAARLLQPAGDN